MAVARDANVTNLALLITDKSEAAVGVFKQWAERWVGIQGGRAIGGGNDVRLGSWLKPIAVRLRMLPHLCRRSTCHMLGNTHSPAPASGHCFKKYGCERGAIDGFVGRVEQPACQRVQGFQVQRLP